MIWCGMALIHDKRLTETPPVFAILRSFFSRFDALQIIPMTLLLTAGIFFIYGTGQQIGGVYAVHWERQFLWAGIGLVLWLMFSLFDYKYYGMLALALYPIAIFLLIYVLFAGELRNGARRWLEIGGISVQPSEIAKLLTIVLASWVFSLEKFRITKWKSLGIMILLIAVPGFLIFREPNLSTALTLTFGVLVVAFAAGLRLKIILIGMIILAVSAPLGYSMLRPYHKARIHTFLNKESDPLNKGWNQIQSELAVGSGGFTGKGFMQGTQYQFGYLPQTVSNSDFIFSVIAEETGFLGSALLIFMYILLMISIFRTALIAPDDFGRYLCTGIGAIIALHTIVNIGMTIRLMPVTGLPLPLMSYGGTFMLATLSFLGIVQSVYARRNRNIQE